MHVYIHICVQVQSYKIETGLRVKIDKIPDETLFRNSTRAAATAVMWKPKTPKIELLLIIKKKHIV